MSAERESEGMTCRGDELEAVFPLPPLLCGAMLVIQSARGWGELQPAREKGTSWRVKTAHRMICRAKGHLPPS